LKALTKTLSHEESVGEVGSGEVLPRGAHTPFHAILFVTQLDRVWIAGETLDTGTKDCSDNAVVRVTTLSDSNDKNVGSYEHQGLLRRVAGDHPPVDLFVEWRGVGR
jgi:hypothetical protein